MGDSKEKQKKKKTNKQANTYGTWKLGKQGIKD